MKVSYYQCDLCKKVMKKSQKKRISVRFHTYEICGKCRNILLRTLRAKIKELKK